MVRIAVGQICSTASLAHNLAQCRDAIQKAVSAGAKALFLPEASDYVGSSQAQTKSLCQPTEQSPFIAGLRDSARRHSLPISVGVHEPSSDASSSRVANTLLWINSHGEITHRYQKLHLFNVSIPDGPKMIESNTIEPGDRILPPFDTEVNIGKIGAMICFDLRFPEISLSLARQGADVLLYPSAFTVPTGGAHWLPLLRARAIESQCYVIAAAQVGRHSEGRHSYGHSVVVDPWGGIVGQLGGERPYDSDGDSEEAEVLFAEIDLEKVRHARMRIPLHRRTDVYPEL